MDAEDEGVGDGSEPLRVDDVLEVGGEGEPLVDLDPVIEFDDRFVALGLIAEGAEESLFFGRPLYLGELRAVLPVDEAQVGCVVGPFGEEPFIDKTGGDKEREEVPIRGGEKERDERG